VEGTDLLVGCTMSDPSFLLPRSGLLEQRVAGGHGFAAPLNAKPVICKNQPTLHQGLVLWKSDKT